MQKAEYKIIFRKSLIFSPVFVGTYEGHISQEKIFRWIFLFDCLSELPLKKIYEGG